MVLHGSSSDWASLKKMTHYSFVSCEIPSTGPSRLMCFVYTGKKGHAKKDLPEVVLARRRKDTPKGKGDHPKRKSDKGKGQDGKNKKKKKGGAKSRAMAGEESEPESGSKVPFGYGFAALDLGPLRSLIALSPLGAARAPLRSLRRTRVAFHLLERAATITFQPRQRVRLLGSQHAQRSLDS